MAHVYSVNLIYVKGIISCCYHPNHVRPLRLQHTLEYADTNVNSAAEIFQNAIQIALEDLEGERNISDDIIVFGCNHQKHDQMLEATFKRLQEKAFDCKQR